MKSLLIAVLALSAAASAQSFTLSHAETDTFNSDNSVTITPTVTISTTDDGNPCADSFHADKAMVMLNGHPWSYHLYSGYSSVAFSFSYTFSSVTLQPGQAANMSYADKVGTNCPTDPSCRKLSAPRLEDGLLEVKYRTNHIPRFTRVNVGCYTPSWSQNIFFLNSFIDGSQPTSPTGYPCWIQGFFGIPTCPGQWPPQYSVIPALYIQYGLDDQQVAWEPALARTLLKMIPGTESNCFTALGYTFCDYNTNTWCTPATTPPLYNPSGVHAVPKAVPNPAFFWFTLALCEREPPGPWSCVGITSSILGFAGPDNYPLYACTVPPQ